jgi:hypothetical protein
MTKESKMRTKFKVEQVRPCSWDDNIEELFLIPVTDGSEENKSFSKFTPSGLLSLHISNPNLLGRFHTGQEYYVDFTLAGDVQ